MNTGIEDQHFRISRPQHKVYNISMVVARIQTKRFETNVLVIWPTLGTSFDVAVHGSHRDLSRCWWKIARMVWLNFQCLIVVVWGMEINIQGPHWMTMHSYLSSCVETLKSLVEGKNLAYHLEEVGTVRNQAQPLLDYLGYPDRCRRSGVRIKSCICTKSKATGDHGFTWPTDRSVLFYFVFFPPGEFS